jgi:hypothetical protein
MPLSLGKSKKAFSHNVAAEMHAGKPQDQAVAIAYSQKRKAEHKADGGEVGDDDMLMDHVASECMEAIHSGDKSKFMNALQVLVHDMISKSQGEE